MEQKNKYLEELISQGILKEIAKLLVIETPRVEYIISDDDFVMRACGYVYGTADEVFCISKNLIEVNVRVLEYTQNRFMRLTRNEQIAYDVTKVILCHECRHLWQYHYDFRIEERIRKQEDKYLEKLGILKKSWWKPHGHDIFEQDANDWMCYICRCNAKLNAIAKRIRWEQDSENINDDLYYTAEIVRQYNAILLDDERYSSMLHMMEEPENTNIIAEEDNVVIIDV